MKKAIIILMVLGFAGIVWSDDVWNQGAWILYDLKDGAIVDSYGNIELLMPQHKKEFKKILQIERIERKIDQIRLSTCPTPGGAEADHIANERNQLDRIGYKLDEIKKYLPWIAKGLYPMHLDFLETDDPEKYVKDLLEQHKKWRNRCEQY